jgi:hypothetical protein
MSFSVMRLKPWAALCFVTAVSCGGSNEPSVTNSNMSNSGTNATQAGSMSAAAGSMSSQSSGGAAASSAAGKMASASGGTPASSGGAGASTPKAGSSASSSGSSGAGMSASAGTSPSAGTGAAAGSGAMAAGSGGDSTGMPMTMGMFSPLCSAVPMTAAGAAPTKGGACTEMDPQLCYKTCGPQSIGFKSETCTNGAYAEQSGCSFPDADYACFKIPMMMDASCPAMPPQATMPCEVAECTLCSVGGNYLDSSGASKAGYCVCPAAGASGSRKWSCASATAWPCPAGKGC